MRPAPGSSVASTQVLAFNRIALDEDILVNNNCICIDIAAGDGNHVGLHVILDNLSVLGSNYSISPHPWSERISRFGQEWKLNFFLVFHTAVIQIILVKFRIELHMSYLCTQNKPGSHIQSCVACTVLRLHRLQSSLFGSNECTP